MEPMKESSGSGNLILHRLEQHLLLVVSPIYGHTRMLEALTTLLRKHMHLLRTDPRKKTRATS